MLYDNAFDEFNKGNIVWRRMDGSPVCAVLVDTNFYTPYRDHLCLDKVPLNARVGLPRRLLLKDMRDGKCDAEDLPFVEIFHRQNVGGIVVFKDGGTDETSPLLAFIPIDGDPVEVFMVAYVRWNDNGLFNLRMHGDIAKMEAARIPFTGTEWTGDDADNPVRIVSGKMEVWNIYGKVAHFPYRPEVEPWVPPYPPVFTPDRWHPKPLVGTSPEDMSKEGMDNPYTHYPYHRVLMNPFLPPWALPHPHRWRPDDWSPQNGRYPVPFPVKPDWQRPVPVPPHFNPVVDGEWGTAFESKPWMGPKPPLVPVIPEGQEQFFCDPKHIEIRRGASAELRFYLADAHDHLIHHIGEADRDVTFSLKRVSSDGSEMRLTLLDKIVFLPVIPGEPIVVQLDQDETLTECVYLFELVLRLGNDRYLASEGAIEIKPAFGTIGDATPKRIFPDVIYVKDYGAKGDGETDDTKAFQDALEAAGETGTVYVDAGEYCLSTDIEGRFVALGVVEFTCSGSATLTNLRDDFVHLYGDEPIHGVKTFMDTPVFASGITVTSGATINGGLYVPTGGAAFGGGMTVASGATIHGGETVSGGIRLAFGSGSYTNIPAQTASNSSKFLMGDGTWQNVSSAGYADNAGHADTADNATSATNAGHASSADTATEADSATHATRAGKLGSATVGGNAHPIYISSGTAVACGATVGGSAQPVWMSSGTITAITGNIGDKDTPVYVSGGVIVPCDSEKTADGGDATKPLYDLVVKGFRWTSASLGVLGGTGYGIVGDVYTPTVKGKRFYVSGTNLTGYVASGDDNIHISSGGVVKRGVLSNVQIGGLCVCLPTPIITSGNNFVATTSTHYSSFISKLEENSPMTLSELSRYRITNIQGAATQPTRYFAVTPTTSDGLAITVDNADSLTSFTAVAVSSKYVSIDADND